MFFTKWFKTPSSTDSKAPLNIVVDIGTGRILARHKSTWATMFVSECTLDTGFVFYWSKGLRDAQRLLASTPESSITELQWDKGKHQVLQSAPADKTFQDASALVQAKVDTVYNMISSINEARMRAGTGTLLQETVYAKKREQARAFKDAGSNEADALQYPYVLQYAELLGISLAQAADDILFKAQLDDDILAKTEWLRLKYLAKVRSAKTVADVAAIYTDFKRNYSLNSKV